MVLCQHTHTHTHQQNIGYGKGKQAKMLILFLTHKNRTNFMPLDSSIPKGKPTTERRKSDEKKQAKHTKLCVDLMYNGHGIVEFLATLARSACVCMRVRYLSYHKYTNHRAQNSYQDIFSLFRSLSHSLPLTRTYTNTLARQRSNEEFEKKMAHSITGKQSLNWACVYNFTDGSSSSSRLQEDSFRFSLFYDSLLSIALLILLR